MQVSMNDDTINFSKFLGREITKTLSKKFNFDFNEAVNYLELNSDNSRKDEPEASSSKKKSNIPLPFSGTINSCCHGVRLKILFDWPTYLDVNLKLNLLITLNF